MESVLIIIFRFSLMFVFALLFGIERQKSHKPLGFGAFIFVSIGACAIGLTAVDLVPDNPLPLLGAVVTGIGFLGAGALIKSNDKLFGVTTAAGIWGFAIIGIMIGTGEYLIGSLIYAAAWAVVVIDRHLEKKGIGSYQRKITITTNRIIQEKELKNDLIVITEKFKLMEVDVDKKENKMVLIYYVEGTKDNINKIPKLLYDKEWFSSCKIE